MNRDTFIDLAKKRVDQLDVQMAVDDIIHFVKDQKAIRATWSKDFFKHWIEQIQTKL